MGTWIKETTSAIYLMEGGVYLEKIPKTAKDAKGESKASVIAMRQWFSRTDAPGTMIITTEEGDEPEPKASSEDLHPGGGSGEIKKPKVTFLSAARENFRDRRSGFKIDTIIIHNTVGSTEGTIATFKDPKNQVSAHYVIDRSGEIIQMVEDQHCAFHAGNRDMNDRSIGIEHEATESLQGLTPEQERSSISLIKYLMNVHNISIDNITAHRCVVNTSCPSLIFPLLSSEDNNAPGKAFKEWLKKHFG